MAVLPSLQVMLSFACSVARLSRFPSHYLPCQLRLPEAATADYLFDNGQPIHVVCRTYSSPWHFSNHTPVKGTERHGPPQMVPCLSTSKSHQSQREGKTERQTGRQTDRLTDRHAPTKQTHTRTKRSNTHAMTPAAQQNTGSFRRASELWGPRPN